VSVNPVLGLPRTANTFVGSWTEFEYGAKGWWTTEFYLDGQTTWRDSAVFTGYRWENRIRPLAGQHWINPVLYFEFENINGADKTLLEVVNHDSEKDFLDANGEARKEKKREIETKLILGSDYRGWNISENFVAEKKPYEQSLGIRVRDCRQPTPGPDRLPQKLQFLPRELSWWSRILRGPGHAI